MQPTNPDPHDGQDPTAPSSSAQAQKAEADTQLKVLAQASAWAWAQLQEAETQKKKNATQAQLTEAQTQLKAAQAQLKAAPAPVDRGPAEKAWAAVNAWKWEQLKEAQAEAKGWQQMKLVGWAVEGWLEARQTELVKQDLPWTLWPTQPSKTEQEQEQEQEQGRGREKGRGRVPPLTQMLTEIVRNNKRTQAEAEVEAALAEEQKRPRLEVLKGAEQHAATTRETALDAMGKWWGENHERWDTPGHKPKKDWMSERQEEWKTERWDESEPGGLSPESKWERGRKWVQNWATEQEQQAGQNIEERRKAEYAKAMKRANARLLEPDDKSLGH